MPVNAAIEEQVEDAPDTEAIDAYVDSLSEVDCKYLCEKLKDKFDPAESETKMSMADIASEK